MELRNIYHSSLLLPDWLFRSQANISSISRPVGSPSISFDFGSGIWQREKRIVTASSQQKARHLIYSLHTRWPDVTTVNSFKRTLEEVMFSMQAVVQNGKLIFTTWNLLKKWGRGRFGEETALKTLVQSWKTAVQCVHSESVPEAQSLQAQTELGLTQKLFR